jgi:hypothetical protein
MSAIVDIADSIVTSLNAASLSQTFTSVRGYIPEYDLENLATMQVTVVPSLIAISGLSRSGNQYDQGITVAIYKRIVINNANLDALMTFVEEIADTLIRTRHSGATVIATANDPIYSPDDLREKQLFISLINVTLREGR